MRIAGVKRALVLTVVALALSATPATAQRRRAATPAPATVDWSAHVETTAEGGYRMGNPNASLKLVEYGSISCSHCATFANEASVALRDRYVRTGRVSFEYRPFLIFPSDPGLFMLLRCQGADRFFTTIDGLYRTQGEWIGRIEAKQDEIGRLTSWSEIIPATMRAAQLAPIFSRNGLTQMQIDACLADSNGFDQLAASRDQAVQLGVEGTPTFFLNGRKLEVSDWAGVEAAIARP